MNKGTISNLVSALVLGVGLLLPEGLPRTLVVSAGMFALSGGLTNSIAIKMLFDRIPGLYGSGVIQTRFEEIREEIKTLVLGQFFNEEQLREYFHRHAGSVNLFDFLESRDGRGPVVALVEDQWNRFTRDEVIQPMLKEQVDKVLSSSFGGFLGFVGAEAVHGMVSKFVGNFIAAMRPKVIEAAEEIERDSSKLGVRLDEDRVIRRIEQQVTKLLDQRLERLTPRQVKAIVEDVIRNHMGWLVVWGNVFGGLLGIIAPFLSGI